MTQIQAVVGKITDLCWEKCVSKPGANLSDAEKNVRTPNRQETRDNAHPRAPHTSRSESRGGAFQSWREPRVVEPGPPVRHSPQ